jgi:CheY-like chemotaxis protein
MVSPASGQARSLVVLDLMMPGDDGLDVLHEMKGRPGAHLGAGCDRWLAGGRRVVGNRGARSSRRTSEALDIQRFVEGHRHRRAGRPAVRSRHVG